MKELEGSKRENIKRLLSNPAMRNLLEWFGDSLAEEREASDTIEIEKVKHSQGYRRCLSDILEIAGELRKEK